MMTSGAILLSLLTSAAPLSQTQPSQVDRQSWEFNAAAQWAGWTASEQIKDVQFGPDCVSFRTAGSDPLLVGPAFDWPVATNGQHVEIDIDCGSPGEGELYFTNAATGENGGFQGKWYVPVAVPSAGRQVVPVWPFWETLGKVARIRFDPPSGTTCRLYAIRIVHDERPPAVPAWTFDGGETSWQPMYATRLEPTASGLRVQALRPMALVGTATESFDAARRSILRLSAQCPGEHTICLYWANRENSGLWGEPIDLSARDDEPITIDLRQFPEWKGSITNLAIGFGTYGREVLTLRSFAIEENDPSRLLLRVRYLGYASGVGRPGRACRVRALVEHAAGPALPAGDAVLHADENASCPEPRVPMPPMTTGARTELTWTITPRNAEEMRLSLAVNGQATSASQDCGSLPPLFCTRTLRVDPLVGEIAAADYDVPEPRPVASDYQIGVYYYPGWSGPKMGAWTKQTELPERDPLLGWYQEGSPAVADWHVKWAVENGISFFVYDWYWRDGKVHAEAALNDGLLKSRYGERIQFAVMWANHKPFSAHTREQLLTVTDYWIAHYLRRPNYLAVDGKPYVSFYSPHELLTCLGSAEKVREALDATRERARSAGLPGLHIAAIDIPGQVEPATLAQAGFDSFTAYTYTRTGSTVAHSLYRPYLMGYRDKWERARQGNVLPYIPALAAGWDGPVWYGPRSERRRGRRTEDWREGLGQLKTFLDETGGRMAILEAWNEWGEGAYIEPNVEFGFGDLEAIRQTFARPGDWPVNIGPEDVGLAGKYDLRNEPDRASQPH